MSFVVADFADDTAYERFVLTTLGERPTRPEPPSATIHLESDPHAVSATVYAISGIAGSGRHAVTILKASLRLVAFGAAYKTLDVMVEHVLRANGASASRLTFAAKTAALANRPQQLPAPFDTYPELWDRLAGLYVAYDEARHVVVHRRAEITPAGDLNVEKGGRTIDTVPADEFAAFIAAVQGAADLVIDASVDTRRHGVVAAHLNDLGVRHGMPPLVAIDPGVTSALVISDLAAPDPGHLRIDVRGLRDAISKQGHATFDLQLSGGGQTFTCRWEDLPNHDAEFFDFDPKERPSWLRESPVVKTV
jgi:hypothetical protein